MSKSGIERLGPLFEALAKEIELEGLHLGEDGYVCLVTESGLHIHFQQEDESLLSICELGRLTTDEGRMEMLETRLAANALWEGTKGAMLHSSRHQTRCCWLANGPLTIWESVSVYGEGRGFSRFGLSPRTDGGWPTALHD